MSTIKSQKLETSRDRLLYVVKKEFKSGAEFCDAIDQSHNWVYSFKNADNPKIPDIVLSSIYDLKNISPLWITNYAGPYKVFEKSAEEYDKPSKNKVAEPKSGYGDSVMQVLRLIEDLELHSANLKGLSLSSNAALKASQLTTLLLEHQQNNDSD